MLRIHRTKLSQSKFSRMSWLGLAGTVSCCALVLVFGLMLFPALPQVTYAAIPEVTPSTGTSVGINLPASIDFESVTPTPDGATTTATADLTVTTTNSASYSLYLYSSDGDNSLRPKISANTSSIIATAGGVGLTLSSLKPNTWGYNLGTEAPTDSTTYSAVPTDNSIPIQTKDTSTTNSANDTYTLSFGAKVDTTIASGAYSNTLTFAVVAEPAMVTVAFNGNGATSGSMSSIKIPAGDSQALPGNTFVRSGYDFTGWNTAANGSGTSYSNGATLTTTTAQAGQTITLYAQWEQQFVNLLTQATYMQDLTAAQCSGSSDGATATLRDRRDNNSYTIAKINGHCWMTQNLRLSSTTERGESRVLTSADSNVTQNWSFPTGSLTSGNSYTEARSAISSNTSYGGYYNYCAASAGTVCSSSSAQDATQDICPKGWRLPTAHEMIGITSYTSAFSPVLSGLYDNGTLGSTGSRGYWWSAIASGSRSRYYLYYNGSSLGTGNNYRYGGRSVRCIRSS